MTLPSVHKNHTPVKPNTPNNQPSVPARPPIDQMPPLDRIREVKQDFEILKSPYSGLITRDYLLAIHQGRSAATPPHTPRQMELAGNILESGLFDKIRGKNDGISLEDLKPASVDYKALSDYDLLKVVLDNFDEISGGDTYLNFKELEQAAGKRPSEKSYSVATIGSADAFIKRSELWKKVDIGVGFLGFPGHHDSRADKTNFKYVIAKLDPNAKADIDMRLIIPY
ncbi:MULTISPECIES: hypothetical protein [Pseudomonas fluorescens group]|uniref:Type III secretion effector protein n=1 Tax=Pseudomonas fluorescens TaxID=294 RepID=A0A0D0T641_PSEFL|nr:MULTISPECIES: hypothetical protein [Pseudomonas fluorescens group]AZE60885.1 hypothetical protein C4K02_2523 [Pseudomonas synxantha]KIR19256.1 hypothetical protein PFLU3_50330 [Pseudomonas fluorescens]